MADLTDVEAAIVSIIGAAIYPNGISQPSALPGATPVRIDRGWPLPASLDSDIAAGICQVTVFPMPGTGSKPYQILDQAYVISQPVITTTVSVAGTVITVSGALSAGEFLTLVIDSATVCSQTGANVQAMLSALAAQAVAAGYAATSTATTLTVPFGHSMTVRQGGQGIMGKVIHRQRQAVMVTVWAPTDAVRSAVAIVCDIAIKGNIKITMPDTSQALVVYSRTNVTDDKQKAAIYRRDLIYDVEYATVQQFTGSVVTSTQSSDPTNSSIPTSTT